MPLGAMFFFLASYSLGTLTGSWLAARISNRHFNAMLVGGVLMLAGMRDLIVAAPHPLWFTLLGIILFLPSAYLGGRLATPDT
ncbi:MAG: hypothetical protein VX733_08225 [Candidatus Latescibacterota bacterium]|nr:hypothetical protein [Candidatus Latescibacterota bacterium]